MNTTYRQRTRVIAVVHSHQSEQPIDLSKDVIACNIQKQSKNPGKFQLTMVPNRNYVNLVYPNDVVNIYIDPGDGVSGFVRTMMGYVDRVQRTEQVDENGAISTRMVIVGSDFQKAIQKSNVYFNNHMRQILDERFARSGANRQQYFRNDAQGAALRNAGVTAYGTPADFIENFLTVLLGFAAQWNLPQSYSKAESFRLVIEANRGKRANRARARIPQIVVERLESLGINTEAQGATIDGLITGVNDKLEQLAKQIRVQQIEIKNTEDLSVADTLRTELEKTQEEARSLNVNSLIALRAIHQGATSEDIGILDIMDFDFVEALAIDGFNANAAIWSAGNQTIQQYLYGNSNNIVNELIFDLRPVSAPLGSSTLSSLEVGTYSREQDELGINTEGLGEFKSRVDAVRYQPAVVFREFPYSVVEGIDLSLVANAATPSNTDPNAFIQEGFVSFMPIFTEGVNDQGRHLKEFLPIAPTTPAYYQRQNAIKHIDSVNVSNDEIVQIAVGRSDDEVFNVIQIVPRGSGMTEQYRSVLTLFNPVVNQVSVARDGLRALEQTTQFANYSRKNVQGVVGGTADNSQIRRNLVRWSLLMDHWYQHSPEFLSGQIVMRARPDIRVGYRLDLTDRAESYYVESVQHQWQYPGAMQTTVQVSRGQRNDPFPLYVPPVFAVPSVPVADTESGDRGRTGRLARTFDVQATQATQRGTNAASSDRQKFNNTTDDPRLQGYGGQLIAAGDIDTSKPLTEFFTVVDAVSGTEARQVTLVEKTEPDD